MDNSDNLSVVSLGAVLRQDDNFILLLEREAGVAFVKGDNGNFIELDD